MKLAILALLALGSITFADPKPAPKPKLAITKLEPDRGDPEGGTYVKINGTAFLSDGPPNVKVYFGSRQAEVIRFSSDTQLIVQAPGGKVGEVADVLVIFEGRGELKLAKAFTFVAKP